MPKTSYSLAIAFVIHILILSLSTFLVDNEPLPFLLDTRSTISLNMGPAGNGITKKTSSARTTPTQSIDASQEGVSSGAAYIDGARSTSLTAVGTGAGSGEGTYDFGTSAVSYKEPVYPRQAIRRELEGTVRIKVKVSPEGMPANTEVLKTSGYDILDKAATDAVSSWKFQARGDFYFVEKSIVFKLKN